MSKTFYKIVMNIATQGVSVQEFTAQTWYGEHPYTQIQTHSYPTREEAQTALDLILQVENDVDETRLGRLQQIAHDLFGG